MGPGDKSNPAHDRAIEEAAAAGIDLQLLDANLALSHDARARQHDRALALVIELDAARRKRDEYAGAWAAKELRAVAGKRFLP